MDYSLQGPSVRGHFQERILEWVAISFSRGSSRPRDWTCIFCIEVDSWPLRHQGRLYIISCWMYSLYVPNSWPVESWAVKRLHCCFNPLSFGVVCYTVVSNWNRECLVRVWYTPHSTSPTLINPAINKPWQIPSKRLSIFNFTYRELRSCEIFHFSATSLSKRNCIKHRI